MRILISTLGTGKYDQVEYHFEDKKAPKCQFIQVALSELIKPEKVFIFATQKAEKENGDALKKEFKEIQRAEPEFIPIPEGKTHQELTEIFQVITKTMPKDAKVNFDFTHSFRHIPMLALTCIPFLRLTKSGIKIEGLYYGAWEARDPVTNVTPIFDLISFLSLMDWSQAVGELLSFGTTGPTYEKLKTEVAVLRKNNDPNQRLEQLRDKFATFDKFLKKVYLNDIRVIFAGFNGDEKLEIIFNQHHRNPSPMEHVFEVIEPQIRSIQSNSWENIFWASKWCIDHERLLNAFAILQEGVVSIFLQMQINLDPFDKDLRADLNHLFSRLCEYPSQEPIEAEKFKKLSPEQRNIIQRALPDDFLNHFDRIRKCRNGLFHGNTGGDSVSSDPLRVLTEGLDFFSNWYHDAQRR